MTSRLMGMLNLPFVVTLGDGRELHGIFKAWDRHMNLVLEDVVEHRPGRKAAGAAEPRRLGLVVLRGEHVVAVRAKAAPGSAGNSASGAPGSGTTTLPGKRAK